jgi:hypothetical protein
MSHATKPARLLVAERPPLARMPALIILVYAVAAYLVFLAVLGYAAGFFAGFAVPKGIDQGPRAAVPVAVAIKKTTGSRRHESQDSNHPRHRHVRFPGHPGPLLRPPGQR